MNYHSVRIIAPISAPAAGDLQWRRWYVIGPPDIIHAALVIAWPLSHLPDEQSSVANLIGDPIPRPNGFLSKDSAPRVHGELLKLGIVGPKPPSDDTCHGELLLFIFTAPRYLALRRAVLPERRTGAALPGAG